jgi:hypothetical protein
MLNYFLQPVYRKKRLGRSSLSDVLSRQMAFRTHILPSDLDFLKNDFDEVDKAMFQGVKKP